MLEVNVIRSGKERVLAGLKKRNWSDEALAVVDEIVALDDRRKALQTDSDALLAEHNRLSKEIGGLFKEGRRDEAEAMRIRVGEIKERIDALAVEAEAVKSNLEELLLTVPNIPHESVPTGTSEEDNEIFRAWDGPMPNLPSGALPHWDLAEKYNLIDFKLGVQITGSGFPLYRGKGARLERALINFFLDEAAAAGYEEIAPPLLVNADSARGTGQLPDKEGQMYYVEKDDLYLIPTAEVPVTNVYRDAI
ncbi:MAG: hypothetical protein R3307_05300, partial [Anaerolineales bacterium]|nr:hypothetical protein [Anaerolineales bacterium]